MDARHAARIAKLPQRIVALLDAHAAPLHVRRWIAWAPTARERDERLLLALHLRRPGRRGGWLHDAEKPAALRLRRAWPALAPEQISPAVYYAAIARDLGRATTTDEELRAALAAIETAHVAIVSRLVRIGVADVDAPTANPARAAPLAQPFRSRGSATIDGKEYVEELLVACDGMGRLPAAHRHQVGALVEPLETRLA